MLIYLLPIKEVNTKYFDQISKVLKKVFNIPCRISSPTEKPEYAYNSKRNQYNASLILNEVYSNAPKDDSKILGITDLDLYTRGLNFVFGQAQLGGKCAIISTFRLNPKFNNTEKNEPLLKRTIKEAIHELGHTFGLDHCSNKRCVMSFSNDLERADYKSLEFCQKCLAKLRRLK